jgi:hypothetical protein
LILFKNPSDVDRMPLSSSPVCRDLEATGY